jgi:hypothetical protein
LNLFYILRGLEGGPERGPDGGPERGPDEGVQLLYPPVLEVYLLHVRGAPEPRFFRVPVLAGTNKKSMSGTGTQGFFQGFFRAVKRPKKLNLLTKVSVQ